MTDRQHTNERTGELISDPPIRAFAAWLQEQAKGATHAELGEALYDLVARVKDTGKAGTLTFTIKVEPWKQDRGVLIVSDEIKLKLPEFARQPSIFYRDDNGNLTRENPDQPELAGLREVPTERVDPTQVRKA